MLNPLRNSEETIRKKLLKATPIGTEMQDVINEINSHKEYIDVDNYDHGYYVRKNGYSPTITTYKPSSETLEKTVGEKHTHVFIGEYNYHLFFVACVVALYGFDENDRLVDIAVYKELDGP